MNRAAAESLILFNRQLASMVALDLPLPEGLRRVGAELQDPAFARTVAELAGDVERGASFGEAVEKRRGGLPEVYAALVRSGEAGGGLAEALRQAASYQEQMLQLTSKAQAALVYPAILAVCLFGLVLLFGVVLLPRMSMILQAFASTWGDAGLRLPLPTRLLFGLGRLMNHWATYALAAAAAAIAWRARARLSAWLEERQLRLPVWREFMTSVLMARFCMTLGRLLQLGVGLSEAFSLTRKTMDNRVFEEAVAKAGESIEKGGKVAEALAATGVFPKTATWLLASSEEKGDLVACLSELGDYYHRASERRALLLARVLEPVIIVAAGLVVGFVVIAFFLPLFSLGGAIG